MKKYLMAISVFLASAPSWAWEASVDCDLRVTDEEYNSAKWPALKALMGQLRSLSVEKISIDSATNKMTLSLKNGAVEELDPIEAKGKGLFGEYTFGRDISPNNGLLFVKSPSVGEIYMTHYCALGDIPFERCKSQGLGNQARHSLVKLNIEGQVVRLNTIFGNEKDGFQDFTCERSAIETD